MKKTLSVIALMLVSVMLIMSLAACGEGGGSGSSSLAGTYKLVDASGEDAELVLMLKDYITLEIKSDNTGSVITEFMGERSESPISFDPSTMSAVNVDGEKASYTFDGSKLSITAAGFTEVYQKQ